MIWDKDIEFGGMAMKDKRQGIFIGLMVLLISVFVLGTSQDHASEVISKPLEMEELILNVQSDEDLGDYFLPAAEGEFTFVTLYDSMSLTIGKKLKYNGWIDVVHIELCRVNGVLERGLNIKSAHLPAENNPVVTQMGHGIGKKPYMFYVVDDQALLNVGNTIKFIGENGMSDVMPMEIFAGAIETDQIGSVIGYVIYDENGDLLFNKCE